MTNKLYFGINESELNFIYGSNEVNFKKLQNTKILITGCTGFFGKWILALLLYLKEKRKIYISAVCISRSPILFKEEYPEAENSLFQWVQGDVKTLKLNDKKYDYVIHGATNVSGNDSTKETFNTCVEGTKNIMSQLDVVKQKALLISSGAVYENFPKNGVSENCELAAELEEITYGNAKILSENYFKEISKAKSFDIAIARCFSFVGPHLPMDKHFAIGNFISDVLEGNEIIINGNGSPKRSYLYMSELINWLFILLLKKNKKSTYNIGSDESLSIKNLAYEVSSALRGNNKIKILGSFKDGVGAPYFPNINQFKKEFSVKVMIDIHEAILRTANWKKNDKH